MHTTMSGFTGPLSAPERNHFFYGLMMGVVEFQKGDHYVNLKRSLINRMIVGRGVVCGLNVTADGENVLVSPGIAIDGLGREIIVAEQLSVNPGMLTDHEGKPTGATVDTGGSVSICLAYMESTADPVPVLVADCDTPGNCAPSTVLEKGVLLVREAPDPPPAPPGCQFEPDQEFPLPANPTLHSMLANRLIGCPDWESPADPCIQLARVTIGTPHDVDPVSGRQLVYNNALLYELILCLAARVDALVP
jgi:hypothetical protein